MSRIFLSIINMSISASYIVLAVLLLRLLLKKAPKWITVVLWGVAAVRLICPFSFESVFSLIPSAETVNPNIMTDKTPTINTGVPILNSTLNPIISESLAPAPEASENPLQILIPILTAIWIAGMVALLIYTAISYAKVKRKIGTAVLYKDNIYQSENVISPFVLGLVKPKIYLPFNISEKDMIHVVAHEQAHIRRRDHIGKPFGFLLLTLHWFNPLMWLGYVMLCRDIELACDEKVIGGLDRDARAGYSQALLTCSVNRRMIAACPLAFGEVGVKDRVKSVLNYKKPAFWIIVAAFVACVAVAVCFLTNPPKKPEDSSMSPHGDVYTDYEGVYITIKSIDTDEGGQNVFNVVWHNETDKEATFGDMFSVEYKSGEEWLDVAFDEEMYFSTIGYLLKKHKTEAKIYITEHYDLSKNGCYRFIVPFGVKEGDKYVSYRAWVEFKIEALLDVESLREQYPEYFALDATNGLDIYVWQMAKNSYSFGLLPHTEQQRDWISHELISLRGTSAEEMRTILSTYNIDENDIYVIPWQNPISSYIGEWQIVTDGEDIDAKRQAYVEYIRKMLFGEGSNDEESNDITVIYIEPSLSWVRSYVPTVTIDDGKLYDTGNGQLLGVVSKTTLTQSTFDQLTKSYKGYYREIAEELQGNNDIIYEVQPDSPRGVDLYYVLIQNDGSTLLVYGHYENGEKIDFIRWIFNIGK